MEISMKESSPSPRDKRGLPSADNHDQQFRQQPSPDEASMPYCSALADDGDDEPDIPETGCSLEEGFFTEIAAPLSSAAKRQLQQAETHWSGCGTTARNKLWEYYLRPGLLDRDRNVHVCLAPVKGYQGHRHTHAEGMMLRRLPEHEMQYWSQFFSHPMTVPYQDLKFGVTEKGPNKGRTRFGPPPSQRMTNAGFQVFTFEIDEGGLERFELELSWMRTSGSKPEHSKLGRLDDYLKRYRDYRGMTVVYSGNKSFHHHLVFDTHHLSKSLCSGDRQKEAAWQGDVPDMLLPALHEQCWLVLAGHFKQVLGFTGNFDDGLKSPFQLRRTPWAMRQASEGHLLGLPKGAPVMQVVLFDLIRQRAPNGAKEWLLHPDRCAQMEEAHATAKLPGRKRTKVQVKLEDQPGLLKRLTSHCQQIWGTEYPKPAKLSFRDGEPVVNFRNSATDQHPSTFVTGDFRCLVIYGKNNFKQPFFLPDSLTETLEMLGGAELSIQTAASPTTTPEQPARTTWIEGRFKKLATSKEAARGALSGLVPFAFGRGKFTLIKSVEGIGKTRGLMRDLPLARFDAWCEHQRANDRRAVNGGEQYSPPVRLKGFLAFSFLSYANAEEKCEEFNHIHAPASADETCKQLNRPQRGPLFQGKVLLSFTELYHRVCVELGELPLSAEDAAGAGHPSFLIAVRAMRPHVYKEMCRRRDAFWKDIDPAKGSLFDPLTTVLFVAHKVTQTWGGQTPTRAWWHPEYEQHCDDPVALARLTREMTISQVVYDEVTTDDFVGIYDRRLVDWCHCVKRSVSNWDGSKLPGRYQAYSNHIATAPEEISFSRFMEIVDCRFRPGDLRSVIALPFGRDNKANGLYTGQQGKEFYIRQRRWWQSLDARLIMLTTEETPTEIAKAIAWERPAKQGEGAPKKESFKVFEFDAAGFVRHRVPVILDKRAARDRNLGRPNAQKKVSALIEQIRSFDTSIYVVSDNVDHLVRTVPHVSARGRNDLDEENIVTIIKYLSGDVFARLSLLAAEFKITDIIKRYYRDLLFQSLGRNCGYRYREINPRRHWVVIHPDLWRNLDRSALTAGRRYELVQQRAFWLN
jgi:hypothetical protein